MRCSSLLLLLLLLFSGSCHQCAHAAAARPYSISLLVPDNSPQYQETVEKLKRRFADPPVHSGWPVGAGGPRLVLALGPAALHTATARMGESDIVISLFSSRESFQQARRAERNAPGGDITAIYADPDPVHQFRLIKRLIRRRESVGILLSGSSVYTIAELELAAARENISALIEQPASPAQLGEALQRLSAAPVLLAVPDNAIYRPDTIRSILLATYRRRQFVIGYSAAMVRAGALATTVTNVDDVIAQLEEIVREIERTRRAPPPQFPKYFSVVLNQDVARSLDVATEDAAALSSRPAVAGKP